MRSLRVDALWRPLLIAGVAALLWTAMPAGAYEQWSVDRTTGNCATCHGGFRALNYVSANDAVAWNTSLHDGHRTTMLSGDCNVCHGGSSRFPVLLKSSAGGTGFSPVSCLGCHGRAEPAAGGTVTGSGLRQHHVRNGVTACSNAACHGDADPASLATASEVVLPPYYFTPDAAHPNKPNSPCNVRGSESAVAPSLGLDNDGDNVYDGSDTQCAATPTRRSTWGQIKTIYR